MSEWQGGHGSGGSDFSDGEYQRVVRFVTRAGSTTSEEIAEATGVGGRTIRAILSEADGREFVLCFRDGVQVAQSADQCDEGTGRLRSQAIKMLDRVKRRDSFALHNLPRWQMSLFQDADE